MSTEQGSDQPTDCTDPHRTEAFPTAPAVTVIVCTRDRPHLLERAVRSILAQDYTGPLRCVVVFDHCDATPIAVDPAPPHRTLTLTRNEGTPGLAGARNWGLARADGELVAFCDDDDAWEPGKLSAQVALLDAHPDAVLCCTGIRIVTHEGTVERTPPARVDLADLLRTRVAAIHPSSFLMRHSDLTERFGGINEDVPHSYGEDYDFLLRASRYGCVVSVQAPLTTVYWDRLSFFSARWESVADGLSYIHDSFPEFASDRRGRARVRGQVAFARAAQGRRRDALRWAGRSLADDPRQLRAYGALAVAAGVASPDTLLERVNRSGRGL